MSPRMNDAVRVVVFENSIGNCNLVSVNRILIFRWPVLVVPQFIG